MLVRCSLDQTIEEVEACFARVGYRALRSFDLQLARASMINRTACTCPHHGTDRCTCQYVVYLVYAEQPEPTTVVVHGYDGQSQITVEGAGSGWAQELLAQLEQVLSDLELPSAAGTRQSVAPEKR